MAVEQSQSKIVIPGIAGSTLTAKQYYILELNNDGQWDLSDTDNGNEMLRGILMTPSSASNPTNTITQGDPIEVCIFGVTKVACAGAIEEGVTITANASGLADTGVTDGDFVLGCMIEPSGASGDVARCFFNGIPNQLAIA
jgi:hypothetical protein